MVGMHRPLFLTAHLFFILHTLPVFKSQRCGLTPADTYSEYSGQEKARQGERTCLALWLPGHGERAACSSSTFLEGQVWAAAPSQGRGEPADRTLWNFGVQSAGPGPGQSRQPTGRETLGELESDPGRGRETL